MGKRNKYRTTKHGEKRLRERENTNVKTTSYLKLVSKKGKPKCYFKGKFYQYLLRKSAHGAKVKVYNNNIYIMTKNSNRLITMYEIPEIFLPLSQWELNQKEFSLMNRIHSLGNYPVIIELQDSSIVKGFIDDEYCPEIISKIILITYSNETVLINIEDIKEIKRDSLYVEQ